ncbi:MAG: protein-L-isoaspartate O-methyltransferase [bacterium]|nr:protein-L-isoaspartate O-methyltransferase [bacterium]
MHALVEELVRSGALKTPRLIEAMKAVDRRFFVRADMVDLSYLDDALPIGEGQTISQPSTVAFMLELLSPEPGNKVLDVGSGSGWQSCLLAHAVGEKGKVVAVELIPKLKEFGERNAKIYHFTNVRFIAADASKGFPEEAPFDRIIAAAAGDTVPEAWKRELAIGGRMVLPVGGSVFVLVKKGADEFETVEYPGFAFVPLVTRRTLKR